MRQCPRGILSGEKEKIGLRTDLSEKRPSQVLRGHLITQAARKLPAAADERRTGGARTIQQHAMIVIPCSVGTLAGIAGNRILILRLPQGKTPTPALRRRNTCCGYGFCWLPLQVHCCSAQGCG